MITESGIPAPYFRMRNPLSQNLDTLLRGGRIYARRCSNCHGTIANPVGKLSGEITPSPTDLKALRQLSPKTLDGYMYWTIAEGGVPFDTAMPSYKRILPRRDIWSVIAFVRASVGRGATAAPSAAPRH